MPTPSIDARIAGAKPVVDAVPLDQQIRQAEEALMRRDRRLQTQWATAAVQGQRVASVGGKWLVGALALAGAAWLFYRRSEPAVRHRAEAERQRRRRSRAEVAAAPVKSASRLSLLGALVSLLSTVAQIMASARKLGFLAGSPADGTRPQRD